MSVPGDDETVREFLRRRGCADAVVEGGLAGLVAAWERTSLEVERGWTSGLDAYLEALDARQLVDDAWGAASDIERARVRERLDAADTRMRGRLEPATRCLWGAEVALYHGWDAGQQWWWFGRPRDPGAALARELEERGL
jgi:hypothetical protein